MTWRKLVPPLLVLLLVAAVIECVSYAAGRLLARRGVFYSPHEISGFDKYAAERDSRLGWPSPHSFGGPNLDPSGSRIIPAFPEPGRACVALFGDSFTYGDGMSHAEAWSNLLARRLGCRVANYGTPGYGTDQAVLRFETLSDDDAPVVVLGHLSENIVRNVNRLRGLLYAGTRFGLKPRFILSPEGGLELLALPLPSHDEYAALVAHPEQHLAHEYFAPGGASGKGILTFPYSLSLLRVGNYFHVRAKLSGEPWYGDFYAEDHPSEGLEITARLLARFDRIARERRQEPVLLLIPTGLDLERFASKGNWVYEPLLETIRERGLAIHDLGPALLEKTRDRDPCAIFLKCDGHLNAEGNAILAQLVEERLRAMDLGSATGF